MATVVRILTDNQYYVDDQHLAEMNRLDDQLVDAMDAGDDQRFRQALDALVRLVQGQGTVVPNDVVVPSQLIVPAPDMSLAEALQRLQTSEARTQAPGSQAGQEPQG